MLSQSTRFTVGPRHDPLPTSAVQTLSYTALPSLPTTATEQSTKETVLSPVLSGKIEKYVFIPQKDDVVNHRFRLRYSPCSDAYHREWDDHVLTRVGRNVRGWQKGVYSFESVERIVDTKNNLVYLERTQGNTGILTWKVDFASCGLVVDQVSVKVESRNLNGGEVLATLTTDDNKKTTISHMEGLGLVDVKGFENAKSLLLAIHLIGETSQQQTRLFERNILSKDEFPLDLKVTLKAPAEMYNKPVILLGLMFSNSQETTVDRHHYRSHSKSAGKGFLHINIVQGRDITNSKDSEADAQVKCYLFPDEKKLKSCKTERAKKSSSPIWDEYFVIDGIAQSQLRKKQLRIRVVNWQLSINKRNSLLGELRIGCADVFDFHSMAFSTSPGNFSKQKATQERVVYSPLVRVDEEQHRNSERFYEKRLTDDRKNRDYPRNQSPLSEKKNDYLHDSSDDKHLVSQEIISSAQNLERSNGNTNHNNAEEKYNKFHASDDKLEPFLEGDNKLNIASNNDKDSPIREAKVKPVRPPPPRSLKVTDCQQPANGNQSPKYCSGETRNACTPEISGRINTPTFSRLMLKLPMSPRRDRRSSWGGESDMSIDSPRGMKSPADYQSLQCNQWDVMITRPKQWIYCWQSLMVPVPKRTELSHGT